MSLQGYRFGLALAAGLFGFALFGHAYDESGVDVLPNRTYIHGESKSAVRVPADWEIIAPYKLRKSASSSVLGLEKENDKVSITIVWSPLANRPFSDVIRASTDENLGDEYALLQTVYPKLKDGTSRIGRPTTMKVGPYTVYKIEINAGPDKDLVGAVYLFEAGTGTNRWKVKIRADYPRLGQDEWMKQVEEVVNQFSSQAIPPK